MKNRSHASIAASRHELGNPQENPRERSTIKWPRVVLLAGVVLCTLALVSMILVPQAADEIDDESTYVLESPPVTVLNRVGAIAEVAASELVLGSSDVGVSIPVTVRVGVSDYGVL